METTKDKIISYIIEDLKSNTNIVGREDRVVYYTIKTPIIDSTFGENWYIPLKYNYPEFDQKCLNAIRYDFDIRMEQTYGVNDNDIKNVIYGLYCEYIWEIQK